MSVLLQTLHDLDDDGLGVLFSLLQAEFKVRSSLQNSLPLLIRTKARWVPTAWALVSLYQPTLFIKRRQVPSALRLLSRPKCRRFLTARILITRCQATPFPILVTSSNRLTKHPKVLAANLSFVFWLPAQFFPRTMFFSGRICSGGTLSNKQLLYVSKKPDRIFSFYTCVPILWG